MNALAHDTDFAIVSAHAISRYRERVEAVDYDAARAALTSPTIRRAIEVGACAVLLPSGHRVILVGNRIITVKPKSSKKRRIRERG